jgi:hypothetical protein
MTTAAKDSPLAALDGELIAAHAAGDTVRMARLYHEAGQRVLSLGRDDEAAFLLTQAYVLSLDCGDWPRAAECHRQLVAMGRER